MLKSMNIGMQTTPYRLLLALYIGTLLSVQSVVAEEVRSLSWSQWNGPRDGARITALVPIRELMAVVIEGPNESSLLIRYPGGDEGTIWATEVEAWLVSLGLPSQQIERRPGSRVAGTLELAVITPRGKVQ